MCLVLLTALINYSMMSNSDLTSGFLMLSGGIKRDQWHAMG